MRDTIHLVIPFLLCAFLPACGVGGLMDSSAPPGGGDGSKPEPFEGPVPKAVCGANDPVETGLQGQVPQADRVSLRSQEAYACNLELIGQFDNYGEGAGWQHAWFEDCAYMGTATGSANNGERVPRPGQLHPGVAVIDVSNSASPVDTTYLTSISMSDPWESLKVNIKRELLADVNAAIGGIGNGGPEFDIYDISGDCKQPQLKASKAVGTAVGHAGNFAQDGFTYYGGAFNSAANFKAIDVTDPTNPTLIVQGFPIGTHDLSTNVSGTRLYFASPRTSQGNGLGIIDATEIQTRKANPTTSVIGEVAWTDGSTAQMSQPITIRGVPYILFVDEGGKGAARLIDISDEKNPFIASKLKLEVHMPENASAIREDQGSAIFGYEGHYCTASDARSEHTTDQVNEAAVVVCEYFESGLRVFDVRDPYKPREIAYYIPAASPGYHAGSYYNLDGNCGAVDWASSHPRLRLDRNEIWMTSQCNGFMVVRFTKPLAELMGPAP